MKSPDEIKKGLELCQHTSYNGCCRCHEGCPYRFTDRCDHLRRDALAYIQQLEAELDAPESNKFQYETGFLKGFEAAYPKWISVKERLPEDGQRVVGIAENGMTGIMDYRDDGTPFAARIFGVYFSNITHWMPLPEPPKEDE